MSRSQITVLLAERRGLVRFGLKKIIQESADLALIGEACDYAEAAAAIDDLKPDVTVVGQLADHPDPLRAIARIGAIRGRSLVLSDPPGPDPREQPESVGLLLTSADPEEFRAAIRMLSAGYSFLGPARRGPNADRADAEAERMTRRELDVLRFLARGRSNAEISKELSVSESTVKSHVQSLLSKLRLRNRVAAVIYAYETGLVEIGSNPAELPSGRKSAQAR
ncbi:MULTISPECIES: response regulator transcription factor [Actinoallomurus]|uniref:response regulator transcription factor n=1 Tax=Actinoallomurus TaxID=667113 RepID=UPI002092330D|nr:MULTISPECIES: response regulator transcription factor [Actinoallomurus]MCO5967369.1 response regulator transcription factor [Actinoallomurus soli]MCO5997394.1 response regulator transcription factor [Actinoallomurus rhizosphaericola]